MKARRLLVLSPRFHGYWTSIERAFQQLGYDATTALYDDRSLADKVRHKVGVELPERLGLRSGPDDASLDRLAASAVRHARPDAVLAVEGDQLGDEFHHAVDAVGATSAVWVYDELCNTAFTPDSLRRFDHLATYSRADRDQLNRWGLAALYVPDAFDPDLPFQARATPDIVHVGAKYAARVAALEALVAAGVPVRSYGREWSRHPVDVIRTWGAPRPRVPGGREVPRGQAQGLMAGAPATVNIHGTHDGFNMRTFEAAGAGAVQFIDRTDTGDLYDPGQEILPFSSHAELIDLARRALADPHWGAALRTRARKRTLAQHTFVHRARALEQLWA